MRRWIAAAFATVLTATLGAGCGGGLGAEEYASEVETICTDAYEFLQTELPRIAAEKDLDQDEVTGLADQTAENSQSLLEGLDPPDELADAHQRLLALGTEEPPDMLEPEAVVDRFGEFRDVYAEIGATDCVEIEDETIALFEAADEESVEIGPQALEPGDPGP